MNCLRLSNHNSINYYGVKLMDIMTRIIDANGRLWQLQHLGWRIVPTLPLRPSSLVVDKYAITRDNRLYNLDTNQLVNLPKMEGMTIRSLTSLPDLYQRDRCIVMVTDTNCGLIYSPSLQLLEDPIPNVSIIVSYQLMNVVKRMELGIVESINRDGIYDSTDFTTITIINCQGIIQHINMIRGRVRSIEDDLSYKIPLATIVSWADRVVITNNIIYRFGNRIEEIETELELVDVRINGPRSFIILSSDGHLYQLNSTLTRISLSDQWANLTINRLLNIGHQAELTVLGNCKEMYSLDTNHQIIPMNLPDEFFQS